MKSVDAALFKRDEGKKGWRAQQVGEPVAELPFTQQTASLWD